MSARDDLLGAVRVALGPTRGAGTDGARATAAAWPGWCQGRQRLDRGQALDRGRAVLDLFAERVADYRATVTRCAAADLAATVARALGGVGTVVLPSGLDLEVPGASGRPTDCRPRSSTRIEAVVTASALGIAETGTVVLDHGPGQGRRAVTLLPDLHVCVVGEGSVVRDVAGCASPLLDPLRPQTWISGPSATSDIELDRVEGVHGPRRLHVVLVAD